MERRNWRGMTDAAMLDYADRYMKAGNIRERYELQKADVGLYDALKRRKLLDRLNFDEKLRAWHKMSDKQILRFSGSFIKEKGIKNAGQLQKADSSLCETLRKRKLLDKLFPKITKTWQDRVREADWSEAEKKLFFRLVEKAQAKSRPIGDLRIEKYRTDLLIAKNMSKMSISDMIKDIKGLEKAVRGINLAERYAVDTKRDAKRTLGSLFQFKHNGEVGLTYAPREVKELIAHRAKASDKRLPKEIITREEMREMLEFGDTLDKALISLLFDSGMRIGEMVALDKSDIKQIKEGLEVRAKGKTGERLVFVQEAKSYVNNWLMEHPDKEEKGPLWVSEDKRSLRKPLRGGAIAKRIRLVAERMNAHRKKKGLPLFTKPVNPHNFRHSRASELGGMPGMQEALLCRYFGWDLGSSMPKTYLHLTNAQVRNAVLATYGAAQKEEAKEIVTSWTCRACKRDDVPLGQPLCGYCGAPRDADKEISRMGELEEEMKAMKKDMETMRKLLKREMRRDLLKTK